eukprot:CAMPEP_0194515064 /NCGR_PEP_ID=MMETSP0253-20130528/47646_1 /TAXON_ID=2966 /ORGANISM="Noctiluca scintillans" /LENGTH=71 /DNA_ID=CAMNT_0039358781 /DNA_START=143 /DNA_END=358 /DNA_ORIENTATION=-
MCGAKATCMQDCSSPNWLNATGSGHNRQRRGFNLTRYADINIMYIMGLAFAWLYLDLAASHQAAFSDRTFH